jgi:GT2 family glycosyltransferase
VPVSVVVVTHQGGPELTACLRSLERQTDTQFEVVLVDNGRLGPDGLADFRLLYIELAHANRGPSLARNVGSEAARGDVVAFLDDDAIADPHWVAGLRAVLADPAVIAVQGQVLPKSRGNPWNDFARHYWLGDHPHPWLIELEGNCAIRKAPLMSAGGFDPGLFGNEGAELTYRLRRIHPEEAILYDPRIVIRHDYADSMAQFIAKNYRHARRPAGGDLIGPEVRRMVTNYYEVHRPESTRPGRRRVRSAAVHLIGWSAARAGRVGRFGKG